MEKRTSPPKNGRLACAFVIGVAIVASRGPSLQAQITRVDDTTQTPIPGSGHDYVNLLSETVDPATGSVSVSLNIPTPPGRGFSLPFSVTYNSGSVNHIAPTPPAGYTNWADNFGPFSHGGWSYSVPLASAGQWSTVAAGGETHCDYTNGYVFQDPSGGTHQFAIGNLTQDAEAGTCEHDYIPETSDVTDPEFSAAFNPGCPLVGDCLGPNFTIAGADGTMYYFDDGAGVGGGLLPSAITDRNGNEITYTKTGSGAVTMQDTVGRNIITTSGFGPSGTTNTISLADGSSYGVQWEDKTSNYDVPYQFVDGIEEDCVAPLSPINTTRTSLETLSLPNGDSYHFYYDSKYGLLNEIVYPNGGWVKYTWNITWNLTADYNELAVYPNYYVPSNYCLYQYGTPVITERQVSFTGGSADLTQDFSYSTTWGTDAWTSKQTTIESHDSTLGTSKSVISYVPISGDSLEARATPGYYTQTPVESEVDDYDWGETNLLRKEIKGWTNRYLLGCDFQTVGSATTGVFYQYVSNKLVDKKEYGLGQVSSSGASSDCFTNIYSPATPPSGVTPDRETVTTYESFAGPIYVAAGLSFKLPTSVVIKDKTGSIVAETDTCYDDACSGTTTSVISVVNHDDGNYPGGTSFSTRGNPTTVTIKCLVGGASCGTGTDSVSTFTYDMTGQMLTKVDPCGNVSCADVSGTSHTTMFSYADHFTVLSSDSNAGYTPALATNAYLTEITNAEGQKSDFTYDYDYGQLTSFKDANGQKTGYIYNDPLARLKAISYPDGGNKTICYDDHLYDPLNHHPSMTTTQDIKAGLQEVSRTMLDGIGHVVQTLLTSDPNGVDSSETTYYGTGEVATVTNPHRSTSSSSDGMTTYIYDGIGRKTHQTNADSTTESWSYSNTAVLFTDETSSQWSEVSDGLGRLIKVKEPDPGSSRAPTLETDYKYDALDNLVKVDQWGGTRGGGGERSRSYIYDSLGRMVSAENPESGTVSYYYDVNGNLASKSDARGITTSYGYDNLDRLIVKSYSDGTTPTATISYDAPSAYANPVNGSNNFIGRISSESTIAGSTVVSRKYYSGYDAVGRVTGYIECGYGGSCDGDGEVAYSADYYYDLAGDITTLNTGIGQLTQLYPENSDHTAYRYFTYDAAGRFASAESSLDASPGDENYAVGAYGPAGLTSAAFVDDSDNPLIGVTRAYDGAMRGLLEDDVNSADSSSLYSYSLILSGNGDVSSAADSVTGTWSYSYDYLHRMISGTVSSGPLSGVTESWSYDSFGNRLTETPTGGGSAPVPAGATVTYGADNRIATSTVGSYSYDASGNVTDDGSNRYLYDAEGRVCAVYAYTAPESMTQYVYDAEGDRVAKWGISTFSCNVSSNGNSPATEFILGQDGEELDEADGLGNELSSNTFGGGQLLYTFDNNFTEWGAALNDWLGTKRVQVDPETIANLTTFASLPFGNGLSTSGYGEDSTDLHFTGHARDWESSNDYFFARYYNGTMGRFMSPDPTGISYADPSNPQTFNLYAYVGNRPLVYSDPFGLSWFTAARCTGAPYADGNVFTMLGHFFDNMFTTCDGDNAPDPNGSGGAGGEIGSSASGYMLQPVPMFTLAGYHKGPTHSQQIQMNALGMKNTKGCVIEFFGPRFSLSMANAPNIDASHDLDNGASGRTKASLVPSVGRPTILIDKGAFSMQATEPFLLMTYLHETANAYAIQRFRYPGLSRQQRALLGPRGSFPSQQQQHSFDPDIGNQFEKCLAR